MVDFVNAVTLSAHCESTNSDYGITNQATAVNGDFLILIIRTQTNQVDKVGVCSKVDWCE